MRKQEQHEISFHFPNYQMPPGCTQVVQIFGAVCYSIVWFVLLFVFPLRHRSGLSNNRN